MSTISTTTATRPATATVMPAAIPAATRRCGRSSATPRTSGSATAPSRRSGSGGRLRLTRRGRIVVVLGLLVAVLVVGFTLGHVSHAPAAESAATRVLVVQPGDTLWSIAARVEPSHDTRRVVAQLSAMNHLHGASVQVGERLTVPA